MKLPKLTRCLSVQNATPVIKCVGRRSPAWKTSGKHAGHGRRFGAPPGLLRLAARTRPSRPLPSALLHRARVARAGAPCTTCTLTFGRASPNQPCGETSGRASICFLADRNTDCARTTAEESAAVRPSRASAAVFLRHCWSTSWPIAGQSCRPCC